jgi:hypothetical protein
MVASMRKGITYPPYPQKKLMPSFSFDACCISHRLDNNFSITSTIVLGGIDSKTIMTIMKHASDALYGLIYMPVKI